MAEKVNGKFAVAKIIKVGGIDFLFGGSKTYNIEVPLKEGMSTF